MKDITSQKKQCSLYLCLLNIEFLLPDQKCRQITADFNKIKHLTPQQNHEWISRTSSPSHPVTSIDVLSPCYIETLVMKEIFTDIKMFKHNNKCAFDFSYDNMYLTEMCE